MTKTTNNNDKIKVTYNMDWAGGLFDLMVKSRQYQEMKNSDKYDTTKKLRTAYLKEYLIPYLEKSINEIITDKYSMGFELEKISFKMNKDHQDQWIRFTIAGDNTMYTENYIYSSIKDVIMTELYCKILNDTQVVTCCTRWF